MADNIWSMFNEVSDEARKEVLITVRVELERVFTVLFNTYYGPNFEDHAVVAREVETSLNKWLKSVEQGTPIT